MDNRQGYSYEELNALITMMLSSNVKATDIADKQLARCHTIIKWLIIGWTITVFAFIGYLLCYDTQVVTYGNFSDSKVNTSTGTQQNAEVINISTTK